ncbi:uncharacterized protein LOC134250222 [Saccostrea cucullata]|uniref:uncharacterized protein LOC134250222 n=1 Tax=Saccostrea cuccullata TaxID=36930 RepID=UPI002ED5ACEC
MDFLIFLAHILFFFGDLHPVKGRGHLIDPPMRSSLWRYYPWNQMGVPKNADDTGLNCGGFWRLHEINNGSCGLCGDPYDQNRRNEAGGIYANGYIVRKYYQDDEFLNVTVDILTNIGGYFEFHLCPNNNVSETITQECLDKYPLTIEGYGSKYVPNNPGEHNLFLKIPDGVTCSQCVLQWKWVGGNNWGTCEDGYGGLGCGKQEEYYNCADVAILPPSANRTRSARPGYVDRKYLFTTTTQNPMMPILPPFIRRSEKFKKFYKKYLEKVMNGMVAGKWSDNAVSRLDYNLEKQKLTNQSKQSSYWMPNRISDFRLTGQYPDSSMPSLSINVPDSFKGKTEYSFLDVVRNSLKFGNFDSNFKSLEVNDFVTGRPVYLPEATLNMPLPPTQTIATLKPAPITGKILP